MNFGENRKQKGMGIIDSLYLTKTRINFILSNVESLSHERLSSFLLLLFAFVVCSPLAVYIYSFGSQTQIFPHNSSNHGG